MGENLVYKILRNHLVEGELKQGDFIGIKIDQTLTQDSTGTMAYLQLEALNIEKVKTKRSVAFVDHNMLQQGFENADDHKYIKTVANRYGVHFSKPGNGICHQVFLERFSCPGDTLIGSDSHTPTAGGCGMIAIGAGGLDVALAMAGSPYKIVVPKVCKVNLVGELKNMVSAKDIILEVLRRETVKGGVGKVYEYSGEGIKSLSVPQRATITNMGAELGATTSIFPSDENTLEFLRKQGREVDYLEELGPDEDAIYDEEITIDLNELEPLVAMPHSPDNVKKIKELENIKVDQVAIGSCTNSSYEDLMKVAKILKGKKVHKDVSLVIAPGSRQVMEMLSRNGALGDIISSGARILENSCGPCIGMGQSPGTDEVSLRTFNRNFYGRSGTLSANVYLVSPEVAAVSALKGVLTDPRELEVDLDLKEDYDFIIDDSMIISPNCSKEEEVIKGPNIKSFPLNIELKEEYCGKVLLKVGDNITTDHIMPSNSKLLPFRSNIPYLANYCFNTVDEDFPNRAKDNNGGLIIGGENYGQGSSREHAALAPLYLGIKGVVAKSFARIHKANLINSGIIPMEFLNKDNYENIGSLDELKIENIFEGLDCGVLNIKNITKNNYFSVGINLSYEEKEMIRAGGKINYHKREK